MAVRAMWKGVIRFGEAAVPVKLYAAVEDRDVHFHLLHDQDLVRIEQRLVHPETNRTIPRERLQKGYEIERDTFVLIGEKELESLEPEPSRDIAVAGFVDPHQIRHPWYDRPYWLGPDDDRDAYFALTQALDNAGVAGIARWTMRKKQYVGALHARQGYLTLVTLRAPAETISSEALEPPQGRKLDAKEHELAGRLLAALESPFEPAEFHDTYRDRVREFIEARRTGGTIEIEDYEEPDSGRSLAASLEASLSGG